MKKIYLFIMLIACLIAAPASAGVDEFLGQDTVDEFIGQPVAAGGVTITNLTVYASALIENTNEDGVLSIGVYSGSADSENKNLTTSYSLVSYASTTNPSNSQAWEDSDIDGIYLFFQSNNIDNNIRIREAYIVVNYSDASSLTIRPNGEYVDGSWTDATGGDDDGVISEEIGDENDTTYIDLGGAVDYSAARVNVENLP
jgi:hypothetical protein